MIGDHVLACGLLALLWLLVVLWFVDHGRQVRRCAEQIAAVRGGGEDDETHVLDAVTDDERKPDLPAGRHRRARSREHAAGRQPVHAGGT
jgi:hypothetical protein